MLREIPCSHCAGVGLELQPDGSALCKFCGAQNTLAGPICPRCERVNPAGAEHCEICRQVLTRVCPNCQSKNWSGADRCTQCGQSLDALEFVARRWLTDVRSEQQQQAPGIKAQEEAASQRRMAQMLEMEERRQHALNEAARLQAGREGRPLAWVVIGGGLILLILGLGAVLGFIFIPR